ncbi:MAG: response regulator [Planctomycetota bacterium]|nr:response regulator [Planctomycetota bacterium]
MLAAEELREALAQLQENLAGDAELARSELVQARERAQQLRLAPVGHVFTNLERAARDAGAALGKAVVFEATGGATRLDAHVLASLQGALLQLVRNAVAHGIEAPAARQAKGKPPAGRIRVAVAQRGNRVSIRCSDDGAGIDLAAVREAAVEAGAVEAERAPALSLDEVVQLLLRGGVTTALQSTEVSGRGIGLEVVRAAVADLKGEVAVETEPGAGTTVELRVPIQLVSLAALRVEVEGRVAALPLSAVRKTVRLEREQLMHAAEKIELVFEGQSVPYAPLGALLGAPGGVEPRAALLVEAPAGVAALGVDRLLGAATVVVRALPEFVGADAVVAGAALDAEGRPELVLDAPALVEAARAGRAAAPRPAAAAPPPILVIDDSLTTRMLEQSILEAAGFEVDLAASAEEGLERARQRAYGLFIVDVEMPGMSGFEFVELVRSSADLRHVPCMLVTSRSSREDLQRGKDAGARAYIVKSEFDQGYLLRTIRELIG